MSIFQLIVVCSVIEKIVTHLLLTMFQWHKYLSNTNVLYSKCQKNKEIMKNDIWVTQIKK